MKIYEYNTVKCNTNRELRAALKPELSQPISMQSKIKLWDAFFKR